MFIRNVLLGIALLLVMANSARADEKTLEAKKETTARAATVDFGKQLGVSHPSLSTLGSRIDAARISEDPVALAVASVELGADEKASGKTAEVKSADLADDAIELAKQRFHSMELKTVAALLSSDPDAVKLIGTAAKAEQLEVAAKAAKDSGMPKKARGVMGTLHVDNRLSQQLLIYIDGNLAGTVRPYSDGYLYLGQSAWQTTYITARNSDGDAWTSEVTTPVGDYLCVVK